MTSRGIACSVNCAGPLAVRMNESLASVLVANLVKNAFIHTAAGGGIRIDIEDRTLSVANDGDASLDGERIFERFYQGSKKEGSTGLGLALVNAVGRYYGLRVAYRFESGRHVFSVAWP